MVGDRIGVSISLTVSRDASHQLLNTFSPLGGFAEVYPAPVGQKAGRSLGIVDEDRNEPRSTATAVGETQAALELFLHPNRPQPTR